jgi:hypothetical protein
MAGGAEAVVRSAMRVLLCTLVALLPACGAPTPAPVADPTPVAPTHARLPNDRPNELRYGQDTPIVLVAGDGFQISGTVRFDCAPQATWDPKDALVALGSDLTGLDFPTPLRSYIAHFRAGTPGATKLAITCTSPDPGGWSDHSDVTVLDPANATPAVTVQGYDDRMAGQAESARAAAEACYRTALAADPAVRGGAYMKAWISAAGDIEIPLDQPDYAGTFYGVPDSMITCVQTAVVHAVQGTKVVPRTADDGTTSDLRFSFGMK